MLEESAPVLISARLEAEERRTNIRLREEQDAAYRAALEADQVRTICDLVVLLGHSFDTCKHASYPVLYKLDVLSMLINSFPIVQNCTPILC